MNELNTTPLQQFIQQVKAADMSQQREIKMDIKTAKALVYCLGELNTRLVEKYDRFFNTIHTTIQSSIEMDGGGFAEK